MSDGLYWEKTCWLFQGLFEKPRMTEALLSKPYFRYLMDIFAQTTNVTGYAKRLYSDEELSRDFYDTKEKKILFLRKMKLLTESMLGEEIKVNPSKIVAGLEPEKTNLFLQAIHKAATSGEDSAPFVEQILEKLAGRSGDARNVERQIAQSQPNTERHVEKRGIVIPRRERPIRIELSQSQGTVGKDDVENIRELIQNLTQNVNPIRNSMDLIPDDIESMNKEMKLWRNHFVSCKVQHQDEQAKTEELLQALLNKVNELEDLNRHQKSKIQTVKSNILQNEQRIQQLLLTSVAK